MKGVRPSGALLGLAAAVTCSAWPLAVVVWLRFGEKALAISLFLLGVSLGPCLALYALAQRRRKQAFRKAVLLTADSASWRFHFPAA